MTIEFNGHVERMEVGTSDRVYVQIHMAMHRATKSLVIEMSRTEAQNYMPGSGVVIQLRPHGQVGNPFTPPAGERQP